MLFILSLCVQVIAAMYVCAPRACNAHGSQKRIPDHLEPWLWMLVSHHVGARN